MMGIDWRTEGTITLLCVRCQSGMLCILWAIRLVLGRSLVRLHLSFPDWQASRGWFQIFTSSQMQKGRRWFWNYTGNLPSESEKSAISKSTADSVVSRFGQSRKSGIILGSGNLHLGCTCPGWQRKKSGHLWRHVVSWIHRCHLAGANWSIKKNCTPRSCTSTTSLCLVLLIRCDTVS